MVAITGPFVDPAWMVNALGVATVGTIAPLYRVFQVVRAANSAARRLGGATASVDPSAVNQTLLVHRGLLSTHAQQDGFGWPDAAPARHGWVPRLDDPRCVPPAHPPKVPPSLKRHQWRWLRVLATSALGGEPPG